MAKIYTIDASGKVLGRLASEVAVFLRGKNDTNFAAYKVSDNKVIVFNTAKIVYTGNKMENKKYHHYSGYPGGISTIILKNLLKKDPSVPLKRAIYDMLPKNTLRSKTIKNLKLYAGEIKEN
ncbi:MAG TPA: 50S ribosomal protein L13 [Candidatus Paceibacterota bacterium]|nr:50S ribosomal protein L13 [Candidatus Paceibacterota bacterium]